MALQGEFNDMKPNTIRDQDRHSESGWSVFVGFDDVRAQQRASEVCDFMAKQFWPEIEFDLHLCDLTHLGEPDYRQHAIMKAATARIVIIATSASKQLDLPLMEWMEGVCVQRRGREGALVGLVDPSAEDELRDAMDFQLRHLAHRAGLDYLTHAPNCRALCIPNEADWVETRAGKMGSVLEEILDKPSGPVETIDR